MKQPSLLARKTLGQPNYFLVAIAAAFLFSFIPRGARKAIESNTNKAEDWLPRNYAESIDLRWFREHFLGEQFALVSWEGCTLGDPEALNLLAKKLMPSEEAVSKAREASDLALQAKGGPSVDAEASKLKSRADNLAERAAWYQRVLTGPGVIDELTKPPSGLDYGDAVKRLDGALVGSVRRDSNGESLGIQSRTTCLVVFLSDVATRDNKTMRRAIERITEIGADECGIDPASLHMGGPPVDNITIDIEGEKTLFRLAGLSGIVGFGLSFWCFRSMKLTWIVFTVGVISAGISLAIVFYFGILEVAWMGMERPRLGAVDAILMSMPAVVYILGLSGAIHIVNYYRDSRRDHGLSGAAESALRLGWAPCALAAFTTAIGLGSLYTSDILPIKKFGMFTAIGVMATMGVLFTILPVFLHRFPISDDLVRRQSGGSGAGGKGESHLPAWARRMFGFVVHHYVLVGLFWFVVMGCFALGISKIETSVQLLELLDEDTDLVHDYAWLEENIGNLVPMEIVLTVPPERCRTADEHAELDGKQYRLTMLERLDLIRELQQRVELLPEISRVLSVATFTPESTKTSIMAANSGTNYAKNKNLEENRDLLLGGDYLRMEQRFSEGRRLEVGQQAHGQSVRGRGGTQEVSPEASPEHGQTGQGRDRTGRELWRISARVAALGCGEAGGDGEADEGVDYGEFVHELNGVIDPVLLAYQQRDRIVQQLHVDGKQLDGAKLCILFRSPADVARPGEQTQESELASLLRQSGVKAKGGLSYYNLAKLDVDRGQVDRTYHEGILAELRKQDAIVLVSAGSDPVARQLAEDGLPVIDVSGILRIGATAATPLAVGDVPRPIRSVTTGMIPVVYKTQRQLLISLRESICLATGLIAVIMMFVLASPMAGLVSMVPNVFPIVMVFGALGWLGIKVDIGIMMTASVALGVAVDDTIHFLTWFRRGLKQGLNRASSTMLAYDRCATAMAQTTIIGGLGLAVFATSTFTPTQQFGYLMITMLVTALLGDLLLLPALLASPFGRFFGGCAVRTGDSVTNELQAGLPPLELEDDSGVAESGMDEFSKDQITDQERRQLAEGPHAALHAKLRNLRREHSPDSIH